MTERSKIPEGLFDLHYLKGIQTQGLMNVSQIAATAAGMCDIDTRPVFSSNLIIYTKLQHMYSNLMVTGGNSLILGFHERLNHDLAHKCPPTVKLRVQAAVTPAERKFGAWIGGSILGSLVSYTFYEGFFFWVSLVEKLP